MANTSVPLRGLILFHVYAETTVLHEKFPVPLRGLICSVFTISEYAERGVSVPLRGLMRKYFIRRTICVCVSVPLRGLIREAPCLAQSFRFNQQAPITQPASSTTLPPMVSRRDVSIPIARQAVTYGTETKA